MERKNGVVMKSITRRALFKTVTGNEDSDEFARQKYENPNGNQAYKKR